MTDPHNIESTPRPDICERWGMVIRTRHAETVTHEECLRRLGLLEMKAVCDAVRAYRSGIHPSNQCVLSNNQRMLFAALDALDAKESMK